jgi:hypothetical protein
METITIKAAFVDCINVIIYHSQPKIPFWIFNKEEILDNDSPKNEILRAIAESDSFSIEDNCIICIILRKGTDKEIEKYHAENEVLKRYQINKLKKWYRLKESNQIQIEEYLNRKNLTWILEAIKEK